MGKDLVPKNPRERALSTEVTAAVNEYITAGRGAESTLKAYGSDWAIFERWCAENGRRSLPATPETVAGFISHQAKVCDFAVATIERRLVAISVAHKMKNLDSPTRVIAGGAVGLAMKGIRNKKSVKQRQAAPLRVEHIKKIVALGAGVSRRDRLVILLGFATGIRIGFLAKIRVRDVQVSPKGLLVYLPKDKTDQTGRGRWVGVHRGQNKDTCPVTAVERWLHARNEPSAPSDRLLGVSKSTIYRIVKRLVKRIGLNPELYSGHSMRAGLVTEADDLGLDRDKTRRQTGHKSDEMLERYVRPEDAFKNNITEKLGL